MTLAFSLDRTIEIHARRSTVFRFFTDSARFAKWWGTGSTIDPVVGGAVCIKYPTGELATGVVRELVMDRRIAFTFGYETPGKPIPPGGSLVTVTLEDLPNGTRLALRHDVADAKTRDEHVQGWRYQLARFADVVGEDAHAAANDAIAVWFASWAEPDAAKRASALGAVVTADVRFRDANGDTYGLVELTGHIGACLQFMPGIRLEPRGKVRRSQDVALIDWSAITPDGTSVMDGTSVVRLAPDGLIAEVVGIPA